MGIVKTKGIIIWENNTGDFDKMLTILTPRYAGKLDAWPKEQEDLKALLWHGTQFLCFGEYGLYKGQEIYSMNSCETIEMFYNLRTDLDKLTIATNITKVIIDVTTENQNSYKVLQLFLNTLYTIAETDKKPEFITSIFKLRLLSLIGFYPNIKGCTNCKTIDDLSYFSIKDNGFKCKTCGKLDKSAIHITDSTRDAIRYSLICPAKKLFSFSVPDESIKELEIISKIYLNEKLEGEYK